MIDKDALIKISSVVVLMLLKRAADKDVSEPTAEEHKAVSHWLDAMEKYAAEALAKQRLH
jgi:hypothetical protein